MIPVLSAFRAVRYKTFVGILLVLFSSGCFGGAPAATLTVGPEGFEPTEVTVEGRPGLRVLPGAKSQRQIDSLKAGEYKVTLEGAPFQATVRAKE